MKQFSLAVLSLALGLSLGAATLGAQAFVPEVETLNLKGFSPDTIEITMAARSRAEWRGMAARKRSPGQTLLYNILHGNPIDEIDPPGHHIIRRD